MWHKAAETNVRPLDERRLRRRVLAGSEEAWRLLYLSAKPALERFVAARSRGQGEVEELLQDTWMVAVKKIRSFDPKRSRFSTWVLGIAEMKLKRRRQEPEALANEDELIAPSPRKSGVDDLVASALATLRPEQRQLLEDKYRAGRAVAELAATSGRSEKAIEGDLGRARDAFRASYSRALAREGEGQ